MAGKVPISGYKMFTDANSIEKAVEDRYVLALNPDFATIVAAVVANGHIRDFDPAYRPASLGAINQSNHFRNFPVTNVCLLASGTSQYDVCCVQPRVPCGVGEEDTVVPPQFGYPVALETSSTVNGACCTTAHAIYQ